MAPAGQIRTYSPIRNQDRRWKEDRIGTDDIHSGQSEPERVSQMEKDEQIHQPGNEQSGDVLMVDDDPVSLGLLSHILTKQGHKVRTATNGTDALESVRNLLPDLVILDVNMPQVGGLEVCRQLKREAATADIPVIFISGQEEMQEKMRAFEAGGVDYITKPYHAQEVLARVHTHLALVDARRRQQAATEALQRHFKEIARTNAELEVLREVAETLNQAITMQDVTRDALRRIMVWLGVRAGWLVLVGADDACEVAAAHNLPWNTEPEKDGAVDADIVELLALLSPRDLTVPTLISVADLTALVRGAWHAKEEVAGFTSEFVAIPLQMRDRLLGTVNVVLPEGTRWGERRAKLYKTIGDQYSAALERARLFEGVQRMAMTDALTGLYNRRHFFVTAQQEFERAKRYHHALSIIMLDIDHFKTVNDTRGHAVGDQVLRGFAKLMQDNQRAADIIGRIGGEEFAILLPETDLDNGHKAAERLRLAIDKHDFETSAGQMHITASLGVAGMSHQADSSLQRTLDDADRALFQAKEAGRNRVARFQE